MFQNKRNLYLLLIGVILIIVLVGALLLINRNNPSQPQSSFTIGIVNTASILNPTVDGLQEQMVEYGYTEGTNITYIYNGPVSRDALQAEIQGLLDQNVDLIVSLATPATQQAQAMTAENGIPVVFVPVTDPVAANIITDLSHPGGNITGIISGQGEDRRLEWLQTVAPTIERIYLVYNTTDDSSRRAVENLQPIAEDLGLELVLVEATDEESVRAAIADIPDDVDAIFLPPDSLVGSFLGDWVARAIELQLPISGSSLAHVQGGVLCSYSYSPAEAGRLAARLVDQILKGAEPGDLPVETADPQFSINLVTANAMGLEIADDVLMQANIVIRE